MLRLLRGQSKRRFGDRLHRAALLLAVLSTVVAGLAIAALTWWLLWWQFGARDETPNQLDLTRIALAVAVVVGGAAALAVIYRRQHDRERGRYSELFGAAAQQLGDADVAVRIAGVYALAGVADEFGLRGRRQQCIDVLCGYLRLPYEPEDGANHLVTRSESVEQWGTKVERVFRVRQNDREVRRTIVRVISAHLREHADVSWKSYNFDFTEAVFDNADFAGVEFGGRFTTFARARFLGDGATSFERARYTGRHLTFRDALFAGPVTAFGRAEFRGEDTTFDGITVQSAQSSFADVRFGGGRTTFIGARFVGARTIFDAAEFRADLTSFEHAVLDGERISFDRAIFLSPMIDFGAAHFYSGSTTFDDARLGAPVRMRSRGTREIDFARAELHGVVSFERTIFDGRHTTFAEADYFGDISFTNTRFNANEVHFDKPKAWVGVSFDWDEIPTRKPINVKPNPWPPEPTESQPTS